MLMILNTFLGFSLARLKRVSSKLCRPANFHQQAPVATYTNSLCTALGSIINIVHRARECKGVHVLFAELLTVVQGARCSLGARSKSDHNQQWLHLNEGVCALPSQMMLTKIFEDNRE